MMRLIFHNYIFQMVGGNSTSMRRPTQAFFIFFDTSDKSKKKTVRSHVLDKLNILLCQHTYSYASFP